MLLPNGSRIVALAGGSTPKGLYELLAGPTGANLPWDKTFVFFGDERHDRRLERQHGVGEREDEVADAVEAARGVAVES